MLNPRTVRAVTLLAPLLLTACAINPATGKREIMLVSEADERRLGRQNDGVISAEMGLYEDAALQTWVQDLGRKMALDSERPQLDWTFRVVDDPVVNAFALPGGYIYVTRGILAHLGSEAELASVLGHEIGHVTARHSASQISKQQIAQLGLGVGSIVAPERMESLGGLLEPALGLAFLRFGRDDEKQADALGLRYLVAAGYDPRPMASVFDTLRRVSQASGAGRLPGWLSTHPLPENREETINAKIAAMNRDFSDRPIGREEYLRRIDGIVFGDDPRHGFFEGNVFNHPEMQFRFELPEGWTTSNQRQAVAGVNEAKDAMIRLSLAKQARAAEALTEFLTQPGVGRGVSWSRSVHGLTTAGSGFTVTAEDQAKLEGLALFIEFGGRVFQLLGVGTEESWPDHEPGIKRALTSFDRLTDPRALGARADRLRIVRPGQPMDLGTFASRYESTVPVEALALVNGLDPGEQLQTGRSYKVVVSGRER